MVVVNIIVVDIIFIAEFFLFYQCFSSCFADDLEFSRKRKRMRNYKKRARGFLEKYLFWGIKNKVKKWHYMSFWIGIVAFILTIIFVDVYMACKLTWSRYLFALFFGIYHVVSCIAAFSYWPLYYNKVRNRKEYYNKVKNRKDHRQ